jgi:hypothetical protein
MDVTAGESATTRRDLLRRGAALAAAGTVLGGLPRRAAAAARPWPSGPLSASAGLRVDPRAFMPARQLRDWQDGLDAIGLRATGSTVHNRYVDDLASRLERVGVAQVHTEPVAWTQWEPSRWSLEVPGDARPVPVAAYVPYSGQTPPAGIEATLLLAATGGTSRAPSLVLPGGAPAAPGQSQIVLFDVVPHPLVTGIFDALDYGTPRHPPGYTPADVYNRAWIAQPTSQLDDLSSAGFAGAIGILDLPAEAAQGMYMPYDGKLRNLPALFVDRDTGARLKQVALAGGSVRLTLEAAVRPITTPNLIGFIPGQSDELVILHSHHDGTNGIEDNGPEAIVAMAQYLTRLPRCALPRTIMVVMSTGHFADGDLGTKAFVSRHHDDLIARSAAAVTIEHLGAMEWLAGPDGRYGLTGKYEFGGAFASPFQVYVNLMRRALRQAGVTEDRVMRPWVPTPDREQALAWPGDGEGFWTLGSLPAGNFITGPSYLLNGGMAVADMIDIAALRRQAIAFLDLVLTLGRVPLAQLRQESNAGDPSALPALTPLDPTCTGPRKTREQR